jgi:hypothetical protein
MATGGRRLKLRSFLGAVEGKAPDHGIIAEAGAHAIDRVLGLGGA